MAADIPPPSESRDRSEQPRGWTTPPCDTVLSGSLAPIVSREEASQMPGKPSSSITDPRGTSPSERIMSSPGVRSHARPEADPTWPGRQTTPAAAPDSTGSWLTTEPKDTQDTNPWP